MPEKEKAPTPQISTPKPEYKYIDKVPLSQIIKQSVPKEFLPTAKLASIFGIIILIAIVPMLTQFPLGQILSGNMDTDLTVNLGYPWYFLELKILSPENSDFMLSGLILDAILYLLIAYAVNIIINFISKEYSEKEKSDKLKVYANIAPSMAEKVTKKIFEDDTQNPVTPQP